MASATAYDTIRTHLVNAFSGVYPVVDFDTIDTTLENGTDAFLALEEVSASEALVAFGDETNLCNRESGIIIVHCFTPAPESSATARSIADAVRNSLRHQILGPVRITQVQPPDLELMNSGLWTAGASAINYDYDFHSSV